MKRVIGVGARDDVYRCTPLPVAVAWMRMQAAAGMRLAASARRVAERFASESRVVITPMPCAESIERRRTERLSVMSFSSRLSVMRAPVSSPPCAASRTTRKRGATLGAVGEGTDGEGGGGGSVVDADGGWVCWVWPAASAGQESDQPGVQHQSNA